MSDKWKEILQQSSLIDQKKLMDYLEGKLNDQEKHEVESLLNDSAFVDDAMEGLSQMKDKQKIAAILLELDTQLKQKVKERKGKLSGRFVQFPLWLIITTITIIGMVVIAFIIYKMYTTR